MEILKLWKIKFYFIFYEKFPIFNAKKFKNDEIEVNEFSPELDDELFFQDSQRNSVNLKIEPKRLPTSDSMNFRNEVLMVNEANQFELERQLSPTHGSKSSYMPSSASGSFPDSDFLKFKKKKAEYFIFDLFVKSYFDKQISAFYLIWDNMQYSKIDTFQKICGSHYREHVKVFLRNLRKIVKEKREQEEAKKKNRKKRGFVLRSKLLDKKVMKKKFEMQSADSKFKFSSFDAKYKTFKKPTARMFKKKKSIEKKPSFNNLKKLIQFKNDDEDTENTNFQNTSDVKYNKKKVNLFNQNNTFSTTKKDKNELIETPKFRNQSKNTASRKEHKMRKLRQVLEKEEMQNSRSTKRLASNNKFGKNSKSMKTFHVQRSFKKTQFSTRGRSEENKQMRKFRNRSKARGLSQKSKFKSSRFKKGSSKAKFQTSSESHQMNPAIARIFFLLSKRFQDSKYKDFFLDQIEVLVYNHGIKDPKIMSILQNLDLRHSIEDLCPTESEREGANTADNALEQQRLLQRKLEKKYTKENIQNLEKMMMIFRADQLFAPLYRMYNQRMMRYNRNFFVNLRFFAKLAPFRKLNSTVQNAVKTRQRNSFSQILFYVKPNLRLLLLIYVISKVKQRHIVDSFRRIYGFYTGVLLHDEPAKPPKKKDDLGKEAKALMTNLIEHIKSEREVKNLLEPDLFGNEVEKSSGSGSLPKSFGGENQNFYFQANMTKKKTPQIVQGSNALKEDHDQVRQRGGMFNKKVINKKKQQFQEDEGKFCYDDFFNAFCNNIDNIFGAKKLSSFGEKADINLSSDKLPSYRRGLLALFSSFKKLQNKTENKAFIKLQEHMACSMFELEVIEAEDCTEEMDDMVGNINMIETGYGNLTGMNRHLAKEKSHIFEEANKYVNTFNINEQRFQSPQPAAMNHSMNQSGFLGRHTSMGNFALSPEFARGQTMRNPMHSNMQYFQRGQTSMMASDFNPMGRQSNMNHSQSMVGFQSAIRPANDSMYLNSTMNMGSILNSQYNMSNQKNSINQRPPPMPPVKPKVMGNANRGFQRRGTIRGSVLNQYHKFSTMRQGGGLGESMVMQQKKIKEVDSRNDQFNIYTMSNLSKTDNNRVNI